MKFNEQGRSMIEMLGVLAIVGVLSVGGIAGYSKAMAKFNTNKAIDQVNMIATNIRTMFASQRSYAGLDDSVAIKAGLIPAELFVPAATYTSGSAITNPFGGNISVGAVTYSVANDAFAISMDDVPESACVALLTSEWGSEVGGGLASITVKSDDAKIAKAAAYTSKTANASKAANFTLASDTIPVSVANATTACADKATLTWIYF